MPVLMARSKIKPENVADAEAAIEKVFSAIEQAQPAGVRYASSKLADGITFIVLLELEDGVDNPLAALPAVVEFQENLKRWMAEPPTVEQMTVIGSYQLF
ncbi:MAG TPA: hypothetical protein VGI66_00325 [Streptosporangiaceae bacterium]